MLTSRAHPQDMGSRRDGHGHHGHAHFWERAMSRGQFIRTATGAMGAGLSSGLWLPALAHADDVDGVLPKPIPQTFDGTPFHVLLGPDVESSTITDFNGILGVAHVQGTGTGVNTATNATTPGLLYDADMRFMRGEYVGVDGHHYRGTFGFL